MLHTATGEPGVPEQLERLRVALGAGTVVAVAGVDEALRVVAGAPAGVVAEGASWPPIGSPDDPLPAVGEVGAMRTTVGGRRVVVARSSSRQMVVVALDPAAATGEAEDRLRHRLTPPLVAAITEYWMDREIERRDESERRFRLMSEHATDIVYLADAGGVVEWVSPSVEQALGWRPEDIVGQRIFELTHPDDRAPVRASRDALLRGDPTANPVEGFTVRYRRADGSFVWMSLRVTALRDEDGQVSVVGGLRDIDELERARRSAVDAEVMLRAVSDGLLDPEVLLAPVRGADGAVTDFAMKHLNAAAAMFYGLDRESLIGCTVGSLTPPLLPGDPVFDAYCRSLETGERFTDTDYLLVDDTGTERWFDVRATPVGQLLVGTWRDVTERHRSAALLAESREHYQDLAARKERLRRELNDVLDQGAVLAVRTRDLGVIEWVSGSMHHLLGHDAAALVGSNLGNLMHPDDVAEAVATARATMLDRRPRRIVRRLRHADGGYRTFEGQLFVVETEPGLRLQATVLDITERLEAERLRSLVSAFASHELRTPLAFLHATLAMLADGTIAADSATGRDLLARAIASTVRLTNMTQSFLELQRLDLGAAVHSGEPIRLETCVLEAALTVPVERGVSIEVIDASDHAELLLDPDLVSQAVINLVANAVRFSRDGSTVEVTVSAPSGIGRIAVRDHGPGVPPDKRTVIFEAFQQSSPEHRSGGSGLGLAIVQRIAELHQGRVEVTDAPDGEGSVFVLDLRPIDHSLPGR